MLFCQFVRADLRGSYFFYFTSEQCHLNQKLIRRVVTRRPEPSSFPLYFVLAQVLRIVCEHNLTHLHSTPLFGSKFTRFVSSFLGPSNLACSIVCVCMVVVRVLCWSRLNSLRGSFVFLFHSQFASSVYFFVSCFSVRQPDTLWD